MTCYLNSLLQTLFMTPEFRNAMYKWVNKFSVFTQAVSFMPWKHNTTQTNIEETAKECLEFTLQTDHIFIGYGYLLADNHCLAFFSSLQPFCFLYKEVKPLFCIEASLYVGKINSTTISCAVACCSSLYIVLIWIITWAVVYADCWHATNNHVLCSCTVSRLYSWADDMVQVMIRTKCGQVCKVCFAYQTWLYGLFV